MGGKKTLGICFAGHTIQFNKFHNLLVMMESELFFFIFVD